MSEAKAFFIVGVKFTLRIIEQTLIKNPDTPMLAFKIAKEAMLKTNKEFEEENNETPE